MGAFCLGVFIEIGVMLGIDPQMLRTIIFISIMILVEVSLALTSFALDMASAKNSEKTDSRIVDGDDVRHRCSVEKPVRKTGATSIEKKLSSTGKSISPKGLKASLAIAHHQSLRDKRGAKLMTQAELAIALNSSPVIINNIISRQVKRIMMEKGSNKLGSTSGKKRIKYTYVISWLG